MISTERTSLRLSMKTVPKEEALQGDHEDSSSNWSDDEGSRGPANDPLWSAVDKEWSKSCVNKYVYFRWSTAFNSKNRFKGIVTGHRSRIDESQKRIDFLTIKTFGFSEDRYRMGKDVRELFVLPNKTSLMMPASVEEELKSRAVRRWSLKEGWVDMTADHGAGYVSTQAETPAVPTPAVAKREKSKLVKSRKVVEQKPLEKVAARIANEGRISKTTLGPGIHIVSHHGRKSMAGRLGSFSFFHMMN